VEEILVNITPKEIRRAEPIEPRFRKFQIKLQSCNLNFEKIKYTSIQRDIFFIKNILKNEMDMIIQKSQLKNYSPKISVSIT